MNVRHVVCVVLVGVGVYACSSDPHPSLATSATPIPSSTTTAPAPTGTGSASSSGSTPRVETVGTTGGSVNATGVTLTIPAGALPSDTAITVTSDPAVPAEYTGLSPLYTFGPDGTVFDKPVTIAFALSSTGTVPAIYWSNATGGYDELPTTVTGSTATASISHFSRGFVAEKREQAATDAGAGDSGSSSASDSGTSDAGTGSSTDSGTSTDAGTSSADAGANGITVSIDGTSTTFAANAVVSIGSGTTIMADDNATTTHWSIEIAGMTTTPQQVCALNGNPTMSYTHYTNGVVDALYSSKVSNSGCTLLVQQTPTAPGQHSKGSIITATLGESSGPTTPTSHTFTNGTFDLVY